MSRNRIIRCIGYIMNNPFAIFMYFNFTKIQRLIPDKLFMRLMVHARLGYKLSIDNPRTFNEKMQWLKLYDRNPVYVKMVDKYDSKRWVAEKVGEKYIVPAYGVWDSFDKIDFKSLPNQFVLKTTHDCGGVIICRDKSHFDYAAAKVDFTKRLKRNFFWQGREWPYKNVQPRILAEKYLVKNDVLDNMFTYEQGAEAGITDYKVMCFNGKPFCCLVCMGRNSKEGLHENFYDTNWKLLPFRRQNPQYNGDIKKPDNYDLMLKIAKVLSEGTAFLRVDFFENDGCLFVGELTFYPGGGFEKFIPYEWDLQLGEMIVLKNKKT